MKKISVIVPVYQVEQYLKTCVDSILNQSYPDFELILVDDGSKDRSGALCDAFGEADERVKILHQENYGLSAARNAGLRLACGEYVLFVDSDDWIEPNTLRMVCEAAEQHRADVVLFGYYTDLEQNGSLTSSQPNTPQEGVLSDPERIAQRMVTLKRNFLFDTSCNKLYRRGMIEASGVQFPVGEVFEDTAFNVRLLPYITKISFLGQCFYHYLQRDGVHITSTYRPEKLEILRKRHLAFLEYLRTLFSEDSVWIRRANYIYIKYVVSAMIDLFLPASGMKGKRVTEMRRFYADPELKACLKNCEGFSGQDRMVIRVFRSGNWALIYGFVRCLYEMKYRYKRLFFKLKG